MKKTPTDGSFTLLKGFTKSFYPAIVTEKNLEAIA
jgi:hypothetical protein